MKRILTLSWLTILLVCCDFGPRQSSAIVKKQITVSENHLGYCKVGMTTENIDGVEYKLFSMCDGGVHVVNHTKELLEIELIQKQINEIDKRNQK